MRKIFGRGFGAYVFAGVLLISAAASAGPDARSRQSYVRTVEEFEFAPGRPAMLTTTYEPSTREAAKPRPLILALHYGGPMTPDTGREFTEMLILPALKGLDSVILAPNCPGRGWTDPVSEDAVLKLVAAAQRKFTIDARRVVVTGFSMGAIGTYRLAARHPELFTAAIAVSGIPDPEDVESMGRIPLYIIQSDSDEVFPFGQARRTFGKLREMNPAVRVEFISGISHYQTAAFVPALKKAASWLKKLWKNP